MIFSMLPLVVHLQMLARHRRDSKSDRRLQRQNQQLQPQELSQQSGWPLPHHLFLRLARARLQQQQPQPSRHNPVCDNQPSQPGRRVSHLANSAGSHCNRRSQRLRHCRQLAAELLCHLQHPWQRR